MNRKEALAMLGLHEDASREQIDAAYQNWIVKYKAADYDDEPEYVRRKLDLLRDAYSVATGSSPSVFSFGTGNSSRKSRHTTDDCDEHRFRFGNSKLKFGLRKSDEERTTKKGTADSRRGLSSKLKEYTAQIKEYMREDQAMDSDEVLRKAEYNETEPDEYFEPDEDIIPLTETYSRVADDYIGYNDSESATRKPAAERDKKSDEDTKGISAFVSLLSIIIFAATFIMGIVDDVSYEEVDDDYTYEEFTYEKEIDTRINEYADRIFEEYAGTDYVESEAKGYSEEDLIVLSDKFTQVYTEEEYDSFDQWIEVLQEDYPDYIDYPDGDIEWEMSQVLSLFGFANFDDCLGMVDPTTQEPIESFTEYIQFLINYRHWVEYE